MCFYATSVKWQLVARNLFSADMLQALFWCFNDILFWGFGLKFSRLGKIDTNKFSTHRWVDSECGANIGNFWFYSYYRKQNRLPLGNAFK